MTSEPPVPPEGAPAPRGQVPFELSEAFNYGWLKFQQNVGPILRDGFRDDGADCVYFSPPEDPSWGYKGAIIEVVLDVNEEHLKYPLKNESVDTDDSCDPPRISRQVKYMLPADFVNAHTKRIRPLPSPDNP